MKCPKCDYLGFDTGDRCKNCGYDFSLVADHAEPDDLDLTFRSSDDKNLPVSAEWDDKFDGALAASPSSLDVSDVVLPAPEPATAGGRAGDRRGGADRHEAPALGPGA